jgi:uncharacterized protein
MVRILFWIVLAVVVYAVTKSWSRAGTRRTRAADRPSEAIVTCAACGLNVPQSEALARGADWFCSREHLERAPPTQGTT